MTGLVQVLNLNAEIELLKFPENEKKKIQKFQILQIAQFFPQWKPVKIAKIISNYNVYNTL